jgi:hypothetical protein
MECIPFSSHISNYISGIITHDFRVRGLQNIADIAIICGTTKTNKKFPQL